MTVGRQVTDDGTTEVTSCGSRCPSEPGSSQHQQQQQQQVRDALTAGEMMSQHERASSWLDNLPMQSSTSTTAGTGRDHGTCPPGTAETRSVGGAHDRSSRSVSYDDRYDFALHIDVINVCKPFYLKKVYKERSY